MSGKQSLAAAAPIGPTSPLPSSNRGARQIANG